MRLVAAHSSIAGEANGGKRLTAKLAVRIASRYAGRTLVANVAATDDDGRRQACRTAGRLRVAAR